MELVSLSLRHWRNIPRLSLDQLDRPLVVLAGPNRTGKTGIYSAIRAALFDDATSSAREVKAYAAWGGDAPPEVILGFRHGGDEYRVQKRFSRGKDNLSRLERRTSSGWSKVADGKQLTTEVKRLLGIEDSKDSLLELLWLEQGMTALPAKLGPGLQRQFETVLGSLLTDRDHRILEAARSRVREWFTDTKGDIKAGTELASKRLELEQCEQELAKLLKQRDLTNQGRDRYRDLTSRAAEAHRELARSRRELAEKKASFSALQSRRAAHAQALANLSTAKQREASARQTLSEWQETAARRDEAATTAQSVKSLWQSTEETFRTAQSQNEALETAASEALERERSARSRRDALKEQQQRVQLRQLRDRLKSEVESLRESRELLERWKAEQDALLAPSESDWSALETIRRDLGTIEAKLASRAAQVTFHAEAATSLRLEVDGQPPQEIAFAAGEEWSAAIGHLAKLSIPGVGELQIRQVDPQAHSDLLRKKDALRYQQQAHLAPLGLSVDDAQLWETLSLRRERRSILTAQIEQVGKSLSREKAGLSSRDPAAELARIEAQLARPLPADDLSSPVESDDCEPSDLLAAIDEAEQAVVLAEEQTRAARDTLEQHRNEVESLRQSAGERQQAVAEAQGAMKAAEEGLARLGEEDVLQAGVQAAHTAVQQAEVEEVASRLNADEERLEQEIHELEAALERQSDRLRQAEGEQRMLEGEFRSSLGLHDELTRLESRQSELLSRLARLEREGRARKLLHGRLDEARRTQVGDVTHAISERTLAWAKQLGLGEFEALDFAGSYLPSGLTRRDLEAPVALNSVAESFGTVEQLALLVRLAAGSALAGETRQVAVLDDPLAHADAVKHRRMLEIFTQVVRQPPEQREGLQLLILTCHPERYDRLPPDVPVIDLAEALRRSLAEE